MNPRVSIGLPVFNGENYISETIDSLLCQSFEDFELIISDNASTDATEAICVHYANSDSRVKYHRYEVNKGAAWNFNNTFFLAQGEYFKWAAHDDPYMPDFLKRCVEVLDEQTDIVLCFARTIFIDSDGSEMYECMYPQDFFTSDRRLRLRRFVMGGYIVHEIFGLIRSDLLSKTPLIRNFVGSDLVLLGMLTLKGRFFQVNEVLFKHREHALRSMKNPQSARNPTQWFDSSKSGEFVFPYVRRMYENAKVILGERTMPYSEKLLCLYDIFRVAYWNRSAHTEELNRNIEAFVSRFHRGQ